MLYTQNMSKSALDRSSRSITDRFQQRINDIDLRTETLRRILLEMSDDIDEVKERAEKDRVRAIDVCDETKTDFHNKGITGKDDEINHIKEVLEGIENDLDDVLSDIDTTIACLDMCQSCFEVAYTPPCDDAPTCNDTPVICREGDTITCTECDIPYLSCLRCYNTCNDCQTTYNVCDSCYGGTYSENTCTTGNTEFTCTGCYNVENDGQCHPSYSTTETEKCGGGGNYSPVDPGYECANGESDTCGTGNGCPSKYGSCFVFQSDCTANYKSCSEGYVFSGGGYCAKNYTSTTCVTSNVNCDDLYSNCNASYTCTMSVGSGITCVDGFTGNGGNGWTGNKCNGEYVEKTPEGYTSSGDSSCPEGYDGNNCNGGYKQTCNKNFGNEIECNGVYSKDPLICSGGFTCGGSNSGCTSCQGYNGTVTCKLCDAAEFTSVCGASQGVTICVTCNTLQTTCTACVEGEAYCTKCYTTTYMEEYDTEFFCDASYDACNVAFKNCMNTGVCPASFGEAAGCGTTQGCGTCEAACQNCQGSCPSAYDCGTCQTNCQNCQGSCPSAYSCGSCNTTCQTTCQSCDTSSFVCNPTFKCAMQYSCGSGGYSCTATNCSSYQT